MTTSFEKLPMQSKKFIAFLIAEATWKLVLILFIVFAEPSWIAANLVLMLTIVLVAAFIEVGFIISQAALDKFVRLAQITTKVEGVLAPLSPKEDEKPSKGTEKPEKTEGEV